MGRWALIVLVTAIVAAGSMARGGRFGLHGSAISGAGKTLLLYSIAGEWALGAIVGVGFFGFVIALLARYPQPWRWLAICGFGVTGWYLAPWWYLAE